MFLLNGIQSKYWICPNITSDFQIIGGSHNQTLLAKVVKCGTAVGDVYANGTECSRIGLKSNLVTTFKLVSTSFDPYLYRERQQYQLHQHLTQTYTGIVGTKYWTA